MIGLDVFIDTLPPHLQMAVTLAIHEKIFHVHPMFKRLKNKRLLASIGQRFRPWFNHAGTFLYRQGDEINTLIVVISGLATFVAPAYKNTIFGVVDPTFEHENRTFKHIGYEDSVINHMLLIIDIE